MKTQDLKPEQIRNAKRHVEYEWKQFEYVNDKLQKMRDPLKPKRRKKGVTNEAHALALSAFALHARCLIDFFFGDGKRRERDKANRDVLARDFFSQTDEWKWSAPDKGDAWLEEQKLRMHRLAVHITYYRDDPAYAGIWDVDGIYEYLSLVWDEFRNTASSELWADDDGFGELARFFMRGMMSLE